MFHWHAILAIWVPPPAHLQYHITVDRQHPSILWLIVTSTKDTTKILDQSIVGSLELLDLRLHFGLLGVEFIDLRSGSFHTSKQVTTTVSLDAVTVVVVGGSTGGVLRTVVVGIVVVRICGSGNMGVCTCRSGSLTCRLGRLRYCGSSLGYRNRCRSILLLLCGLPLLKLLELGVVLLLLLLLLLPRQELLVLKELLVLLLIHCRSPATARNRVKSRGKRSRSVRHGLKYYQESLLLLCTEGVQEATSFSCAE